MLSFTILRPPAGLLQLEHCPGASRSSTNTTIYVFCPTLCATFLPIWRLSQPRWLGSDVMMWLELTMNFWRELFLWNTSDLVCLVRRWARTLAVYGIPTWRKNTSVDAMLQKSRKMWNAKLALGHFKSFYAQGMATTRYYWFEIIATRRRPEESSKHRVSVAMLELSGDTVFGRTL